MRFVSLFIGSLLGAGALGAATIDSFQASADPNSPFSATINYALSNNVGRITNTTITCPAAGPEGATGPCIGPVADFSATFSGLTADSVLTINIDGNLSGSTQATGIVVFTDIPLPPFPFTAQAGNFNTLVVRGDLPTGINGDVTADGYLSLALAPGQTLTLPDSLTFTVTGGTSAVPEPATAALTGAGLLFALGVIRKSRKA